MADLLPAAAKKALEGECRKLAKKVKKEIKPEFVGKELGKAVEKGVCKQVKSIDKKIAQFVVDQVKKAADKGKKDTGAAPVPSPDAKPAWSAKPPGSGVPSLELDITEWVLDPKHDTKAKFSIKAWVDPKDLSKDKGAMVYFTVVNW